MDDIISAVKEEQEEPLFHHLNSVDLHIKFIMEDAGNDCSNIFMDTKCFHNSDHTIHTSVYRETNPYQSLPNLQS